MADLKTMDGGYLEAEMMAKAGATHVVVMARGHPATVKTVVKAGRDYGVRVMGDDLGCEDKPAAARMLEDPGVPHARNKPWPWILYPFLWDKLHYRFTAYGCPRVDCKIRVADEAGECILLWLGTPGELALVRVKRRSAGLDRRLQSGGD